MNWLELPKIQVEVWKQSLIYLGITGIVAWHWNMFVIFLWKQYFIGLIRRKKKNLKSVIDIAKLHLKFQFEFEFEGINLLLSHLKT